MSGLYISDYISERGIWKFLRLQFDPLYTAKPLEGWVKPERLATVDSRDSIAFLGADVPRAYNSRYPSGYIVPFHYKHPVTIKRLVKTPGIRL